MKYNVISQIGFNVLEDLLKNRGIEDIEKFLNLNSDVLEDINNYENMEEGFQLYYKHVFNNNKIMFIMDADLDGVTSCAEIYNYSNELKTRFNLKCKFKYKIHKGKNHGFSEYMINEAIKDNIDLIICPDAGTNDYEAHKHLKEKGIDILILDHHKADKGYSRYATTINNQLSNKIKNKYMTGVGVTYKFCKYVDKKLGLNIADNYLDLVAIGMIGDSCDLRDLESRYLVLKGIDLINKKQNKNRMITELVESQSYSLKGNVSILGVSFYIAPMVNAVIRNGSIDEKKDMFLAFTNSDEIRIDKIRGKGEVEMPIQKYIVRVCERCRRMQKRITQKGFELISEQINEFNLKDYGVLVCNAKDIEQTYTGLIANKVASSYKKPCILLRPSISEKEYGGSGRGYSKHPIKNLREWCNKTKLFNFAEGHDQSFGVGISEININDLMIAAKNASIGEEFAYDVDGEFDGNNIKREVVLSVGKYKDLWGNGLNEPIFAIKNINLEIKDILLMGKNKNTMKLKVNGIDMIKFNFNEEEYEKIQKLGKYISATIIGKFDINNYNGVSYPQIMIEDIEFKEGQSKKFIF